MAKCHKLARVTRIGKAIFADISGPFLPSSFSNFVAFVILPNFAIFVTGVFSEHEKSLSLLRYLRTFRGVLLGFFCFLVLILVRFAIFVTCVFS